MKNTRRVTDIYKMEKWRSFRDYTEQKLILSCQKLGQALKVFLLPVRHCRAVVLWTDRRAVFTAFVSMTVISNAYGIITVCHADCLYSLAIISLEPMK